MSEYTPDEWAQDDIRLAFAESFTLHTMEEPHLSQAYGVFDRFISKVKADAWDEGLQAGWEECQNPGPFVNDWWDSKAPNPHRIDEEA